jgi:archaemetzincin
MQAIKLIAYGKFDEELLEKMASEIALNFGLPVKLAQGHIDLGEYYDAGRRQYNANKLITTVDSSLPDDALKAMGLFNVDLFIPILTYIFGQAYLNGRTGIASLHRLKNEYYGMKANNQLLFNRFKKEIIHELGHTFGLKHCHHPTCVMVSSTYVEDIDQKESHFCQQCRSELDMSIGLLKQH